MMQTVADAEALIDLLHALNEQGIWPSVAFIDAGGVTGVAYGIDEGDEMGTAFFSDPGEDRSRANSPGDDESYITPFERPISALRGPIVVLHQSSEGES